ncbi:MAG: YbaK/EbsC family protein [Actinobacteria bacterium]|nr:MAG: YbaK/EbsC family protein [Actinomycetota bacterium]
MTELHPTNRRVADAAAAVGVDIAIQRFPEGTKTSADAAAAAGCPLSAIAKSLVFVVEGSNGAEPVIAVLSGDHRLDTDKLAAVAGGNRSRRATLDEVRDATGFAPGGTAVFGLARPIRIFADEGLRRNDPIWSAAGTPDAIYPISLQDFDRAVEPTWVEIAAD